MTTYYYLKAKPISARILRALKKEYLLKVNFSKKVIVPKTFDRGISNNWDDTQDNFLSKKCGKIIG